MSNKHLISFNSKEKKEILEQMGFIVKTVKSWDSRPCYHNDTEEFDVDVTIAYNKDPNCHPSEEDLKERSTKLDRTIGLDKVFETQFKIAIIKLMLLHKGM